MAKLRRVTAKGIDVIDLSLGDLISTHDDIKKPQKRIDDNWSHYPPVAGYPIFVKPFAQNLKRQ
jgi:aspartate aminotransferase